MDAHVIFLAGSIDYKIQVPDWMVYVILTVAVVGVAVVGLLIYFLPRKRK
jgi:uncharacterized membrane protein